MSIDLIAMETSSWLVFVLRTIIFFVIPLTFLVVKGKKKLQLNSLVEKFPGPFAWPLIGNAGTMGSNNLAGTLDKHFISYKITQ
jgi:hypothetical protein